VHTRKTGPNASFYDIPRLSAGLTGASIKPNKAIVAEDTFSLESGMHLGNDIWNQLKPVEEKKQENKDTLKFAFSDFHAMF
jgi:hypothetical protein